MGLSHKNGWIHNEKNSYEQMLKLAKIKHRHMMLITTNYVKH